MRGTIHTLLITGVLAAAAEAGGSDALEAPIRLKADGQVIDTGQYVAHAGPLFADYDGDKIPDLLVGNFRGHIQLYRNVGTAKAPRFTSAGLLEVDGKPVRINNW